MSFISLLCACEESASKEGSYSFKSARHSVELNLNSDGTFTQEIKDSSEVVVILHTGKWVEEGRAIKFDQFYYSASSLDGEILEWPRLVYSVLGSFVDGFIVFGEDRGYVFVNG